MRSFPSQPRRASGLRVARPGPGLVLALTLLLGACRGGGGAPEAAHTRAAPIEAAGGVVRGADTGLELWSVVVVSSRAREPGAPTPLEGVGPPAPPTEEASTPTPTPAEPLRVTDLRPDLAELLAPYADRPVPLGETERARWRAAGLRLVAVPLAELDALREGLRAAGPVQRQWLGEIPRWTDIVAGPVSRERRAIELEGHRLVLGPGRLRLLARCWVAPGDDGADGPEAVLRLEIAPQHVPILSDRERLAREAGLHERPSGEDEGVVFRRLTVALSLREGEAYLIVPESPSVEWGGPGPGVPGPDVGPPASGIPSLGEAMLTTWRAGRIDARAIVALVPRVPESFRLIAR